jgi:hypothetical protein
MARELTIVHKPIDQPIGKFAMRLRCAGVCWG